MPNIEITDEEDTSSEDSSIDESNKENRKSDRKQMSFNLLLTNARSLAPKLGSLINNMRDLDIDISIISESWLKPGTILNEEIDDLRQGEGLDLFHCSRMSRNGRAAGGGIAIIANRRRCILSEYKIKRGRSEILCTTGKLVGNSRKIAILAVYISPRCRAKQYHQTLENVSNAILKIKEEMHNPYIIVAGDFNRRKIEEAIGDYPDLILTNTPPTRNGVMLDLVATNYDSEIVSSYSIPPLLTEDMRASDHEILIIEAKLNHVHMFENKNIRVRPRTKKGEAMFHEKITKFDWTDFLKEEDPNLLAEKLEQITSDWMDISFPPKTFKIKTTDDPWITYGIKKMIKARKRRYGRTLKRDARWREIKRETERMIKESKKEFYEATKAKAKETNNIGLYYKAVAQIKDQEKKPPFDVRTLFNGKTDLEIGNEIASFFNAISEGHTPLEEPEQISKRPRLIVTRSDVEKRILECKKPKSMVGCDVFPDLISKYVGTWAIPLTHVFNASFTCGVWPAMWKEETVVVIPKTSAPDSLNDLRNLSCTPLFSKIMEFFVLEHIKSQIKLRPNQYGGRKATGADHYLISVWNEVLEGLEDKQSVCNLLAVDFKKAFNTMDHTACLSALNERGADQGTQDIVRAFLTERTMRVRMGEAYSDIFNIRGGSPQGTLLGNILFTITTDKIEIENTHVGGTPPPIRPALPPPINETPKRRPIGSNTSTPVGVFRSLSGLSDTSDVHAADYFRRSDRTERYDMSYSESEDENETLGPSFWQEEIPIPGRWTEKDIAAAKYIDDLTSIEKLYFPSSYSVFSQNKPVQMVRAKLSEKFFDTVTKNAKMIGMAVNTKKTQMICVNAAVDSVPKTYMKTSEGERIESDQNRLKVLGFYFSSSPTIHEHVDVLKSKYRTRAWVIRHMKKAGADKTDLVQLYKALVRPILDYLAPVYHSMLSATQREDLERLQRGTLKTIYGHDVSYADALEESGLPTLNERRQELFDNFAMKLANNPEYREWLPKTEFTGYDLRKELIFTEKFASTDRLYNSPLYAIRRRLNEIYHHTRKTNQNDIRPDWKNMKNPTEPLQVHDNTNCPLTASILQTRL